MLLNSFPFFHLIKCISKNGKHKSNTASFSEYESRGCKGQVGEGQKFKKRGSAASEQERWHPGKGRYEVHQGRVWWLTYDPKGRGQRQKIDCSCVATCNPTVMPITVICLDRHVPTHFAKHALTGAERENEKREGWKEMTKEEGN